MGKYFGTDGVRAVAGQFPLTDDFICKLGYCALKELGQYAEKENLKKQVIIARDTRLSGPSILKQLSAGIRAAGADVLDMGISTTPSVALAVKQTSSVCGVVISASHNPAEFNGIKFFTAAGTKLPEDLENKIEAAIVNKLIKVSYVITANITDIIIKNTKIIQSSITYLSNALIFC